MTLALQHPFSDLFDWSNDVNRLLNGNHGFRLVPDREANAPAVPATDIEVDDNEIRITADLPGLDKKDIDVQVDSNRLTISATRSAEKSTEEGGYVRRERHFGNYSRSFSLPDVADLDNLNASYKDGVLTITVPKVPEAKPRQIKVS